MRDSQQDMKMNLNEFIQIVLVAIKYSIPTTHNFWKDDKFYSKQFFKEKIIQPYGLKRNSVTLEADII